MTIFVWEWTLVGSFALVGLLALVNHWVRWKSLRKKQMMQVRFKTIQLGWLSRKDKWKAPIWHGSQWFQLAFVGSAALVLAAGKSVLEEDCVSQMNPVCLAQSHALALASWWLACERSFLRSFMGTSIRCKGPLRSEHVQMATLVGTLFNVLMFGMEITSWALFESSTMDMFVALQIVQHMLLFACHVWTEVRAAKTARDPVRLMESHALFPMCVLGPGQEYHRGAQMAWRVLRSLPGFVLGVAHVLLIAAWAHFAVPPLFHPAPTDLWSFFVQWVHDWQACWLLLHVVWISVDLSKWEFTPVMGSQHFDVPEKRNTRTLRAVGLSDTPTPPQPQARSRRPRVPMQTPGVCQSTSYSPDVYDPSAIRQSEWWEDLNRRVPAEKEWVFQLFSCNRSGLWCDALRVSPLHAWIAIDLSLPPESKEAREFPATKAAFADWLALCRPSLASMSAPNSQVRLGTPMAGDPESTSFLRFASDCRRAARILHHSTDRKSADSLEDMLFSVACCSSNEAKHMCYSAQATRRWWEQTADDPTDNVGYQWFRDHRAFFTCEKSGARVSYPKALTEPSSLGVLINQPGPMVMDMIGTWMDSTRALDPREVRSKKDWINLLRRRTIKCAPADLDGTFPPLDADQKIEGVLHAVHTFQSKCTTVAELMEFPGDNKTLAAPNHCRLALSSCLRVVDVKLNQVRVPIFPWTGRTIPLKRLVDLAYVIQGSSPEHASLLMHHCARLCLVAHYVWDKSQRIPIVNAMMHHLACRWSYRPVRDLLRHHWSFAVRKLVPVIPPLSSWNHPFPSAIAWMFVQFCLRSIPMTNESLSGLLQSLGNSHKDFASQWGEWDRNMRNMKETISRHSASVIESMRQTRVATRLSDILKSAAPAPEQTVFETELSHDELLEANARLLGSGPQPIDERTLMVALVFRVVWPLVLAHEHQNDTQFEATLQRHTLKHSESAALAIVVAEMRKLFGQQQSTAAPSNYQFILNRLLI